MTAAERILAKLKYDLSCDQARPMLEVDTEKLKLLLTDRERLIEALKSYHETRLISFTDVCSMALTQSAQTNDEILGERE